MKLLVCLVLAGCAVEPLDDADQDVEVKDGWSWTSNTVPYCIVPTLAPGDTGFSPGDITAINATLATLQTRVPVTFTYYASCFDPNLPAKHVQFQSNGDDELVLSGSVYIAPLIGAAPYNVSHAIGHVLGFADETQRGDAASYVDYYAACVEPANRSHFMPPAGYSLDELTPYDTSSVMQSYTGRYSYKPVVLKPPSGCPDVLVKGTTVFDTATGINGTTFTTYGRAMPTSTSVFSREDINATWQLFQPSLDTVEAGDHFGSAMVSADFDQDGYDDLAVAAPDDHGGKVFLYKGTFNGLVAWRVIQRSSPAATDRFGAGLAAGMLGGSPLLVVGAPGYGAGGAVFVFKGDVTGLVPVAGPIIGAAGAKLGTAVSIGSAIVAVGAPLESSVGAVHDYQWTGSTLVEIGHVSPSTPLYGGMFGASVIAADLNVDGHDDLVVGAPAPGTTSAGTVSQFTGDANGAMTYKQALVPNSNSGSVTLGVNASYGASLAYNKLIGWLAIGAPGAGTVVTYYVGGTSPIPGPKHLGSSSFGTSVAIADLDGDNRPDLVVSDIDAQGTPPFGAYGGAVYVYSNNGSQLTLKKQMSIDGDNLGASIAIGDFNHDGHPDVAVGAPASAGSFAWFRNTGTAFGPSVTRTEAN
ncbi:MAG: FG-GAP-like repeat-containing protein [Kofleriaceae bacterium]